METEFETLCASLSLEKGTINNLLKSEAVRKTFLEVVAQSGLKACEKKVGNLLYGVATKLPVTIEKHRKYLAELVGSGQIYNSSQFDFVLEYLKENQKKGLELEIPVFVEKCGVGKPPSAEDIARAIANVFEQHLGSGCKKFDLLDKVKKQLPFADGLTLKEEFEKEYTKRVPEEPKDATVATKKAAPEKAPKKEEQKTEVVKDINDLIGRDMNSLVNTKELIAQHAQQFGEGCVLTRFPPEPNGYLHIGHAKAMRFNFNIAKHNNGHCYLRYDDTNPEKECQEYIDNIEENIRFMGYQPWKITHASDLFEKLYEYALVLIKKGKAYVCGESIELMRANRNECKPSAYRDRPIEENLKLFKEMRMGLYAEGEYSLRAKIDYAHANPTLRDPVIYRIRYTPHPHAKDKWCIYPLYDYTHPICDSLEGITHSLCTLEFEIRRELYYWVLEELNLYRPYVWEYSRLNISNTVLSKRKLHKLVFEGFVSGWDDPRILTLNGMKRRGYTAEAINNFCDEIGVARKGNEKIINMHVLENEVRKVLDLSAPRTLAVVSPVLLIIENFGAVETIEVPLFPKDVAKGKRSIRTGREVYVDRSDVREVDNPDFFGIAPGKRVGLKYSHILLIKSVTKSGDTLTVSAVIDEDQKTKPKSFLHWIAADESVVCETRIYGPLFSIHNPNEAEDYIKELNPQSLVVHRNSRMHKELVAGLKHLDKVQFERVGYFSVDYDSKEGKIVWNQTVGLLQDKAKKE